MIKNLCYTYSNAHLNDTIIPFLSLILAGFLL